MPSRANKQKRFQTDKQTSRNHLESAGGCWWWAGLFGAIALNQGGSESFSLVALLLLEDFYLSTCDLKFAIYGLD
jgi:fatty acid desaturase